MHTSLDEQPIGTRVPLRVGINHNALRKEQKYRRIRLLSFQFFLPSAFNCSEKLIALNTNILPFAPHQKLYN